VIFLRRLVFAVLVWFVAVITVSTLAWLAIDSAGRRVGLVSTAEAAPADTGPGSPLGAADPIRRASDLDAGPATRPAPTSDAGQLAGSGPRSSAAGQPRQSEPVTAAPSGAGSGAAGSGAAGSGAATSTTPTTSTTAGSPATPAKPDPTATSSSASGAAPAAGDGSGPSPGAGAGHGQGPAATHTGGPVAALGTRAGTVLLTCSATGISDWRVLPAAGWAAYTLPTGPAEMTVFFRQAHVLDLATARCTNGVASIVHGGPPHRH
jgi:hypothetical protein